MKQVLSLFTFGIAALFFLTFFATLKPTVVSAASGPGKPGQCSTKAPPSLSCRSLTFATALWPDIARQNCQISLRLQSAVWRKLLPYCPLLKPNAYLMNLASRPIGVMQRKQTFIGILLLSLALVPRAAMAEINDGSLSSTGQSTPVHRETNTHSDQRFLAAFRAAHLPLIEAIAIAERLHVGSRTAAISFDTSDNPSYRVRTVKGKEIWENVIDVRTGRTAGPETAWSLNELEMEERDNIKALRSVKQELSDAVAIAAKAAAGKAISGGLVKEGDHLNFVVVVLSDDHVKEVFLEPPGATSKRQPAGARKN